MSQVEWQQIDSLQRDDCGKSSDRSLSLAGRSIQSRIDKTSTLVGGISRRSSKSDPSRGYYWCQRIRTTIISSMARTSS